MSVLDRPTAEQVLARIACLFLQILRMELELEFQEVTGAKEKTELREELDEFRESLEEDPFIAGATTEENRRIRADFGAWTEDDFIISARLKPVECIEFRTGSNAPLLQTEIQFAQTLHNLVA